MGTELQGRIPLLRSAVMQSVIQAARDTGVPLDKMARKVGFPLHLMESNEAWLPQIPCWRLVGFIAQTEGDPLFGLRAAVPIPHHQVATVAPFILHSANLYQLLLRFRESVPYQTNINQYCVRVDDRLAWFCREGLQLGAGARQVELFSVLGMLQLLQFVLGADWRPTRIHLLNSHCRHTAAAEALNPTEIHFSQPYTAIGFPLALLVTSLADSPAHHLQQGIERIKDAPDSLPERLALVLDGYIGHAKIDERLLRASTGMSLRSLQRQLAESGTSYRMILDRVRFNKACHLLAGSGDTLQKISTQLGYENPPAFTRAFRRWAGVPPKTYRSLRLGQIAEG